ncbi:hypothetical protein [Microbacterium sp. gxy059]|uniref:hypothetical protein n=1 Tax=Microbacterium sp. gxy059 TaxID=2957199 RepID=UPI003D99905B
MIPQNVRDDAPRTQRADEQPDQSGRDQSDDEQNDDARGDREIVQVAVDDGPNDREQQEQHRDVRELADRQREREQLATPPADAHERERRERTEDDEGEQKTEGHEKTPE